MVFLRVIAIVTVDDLKALIRNAVKNDIFDFTTTAITPILALAESWQPDWTELFKKLLRRIKAGKGCKKDESYNNGMYVALPFSMKNREFMVIFYTPQCLHGTKRFLIYGFRIVKTKR